MSIHPVLIDRRPAFLSGRSSSSSLLLLPTGGGLLLESMLAALESVTRARPIVLPRFERTEDYTRALRRVIPAMRVEDGTPSLIDHLSTAPSSTAAVAQAATN